MEIKLEISSMRIMQLFASAIEGGDPVTTASKGGWCSGIDLRGADWPMGEGPADAGTKAWWSDPEYFADSVHLDIEIIEVDDETTGHETKHTVKNADIARGLTVMAGKFPHLFAEVLNDDIDAPCADIFLQCMLFGEEKYA